VKTPAIVTLLAAGTLAAGCAATSSGGSAAATPPQAPAAQATPSSSAPAAPVSASATPTPSQASGPAACPTSNLRIVTAPGGGGAAGSIYADLRFTNTGPATCTLYGYPGVSFTTKSHAQLGRSASRAHGPAHVVTLKPGRVASVQYQTFDVSVFPASACRPTTSAFIKVYPPDQTAPVYLPSKTQVCTTAKGRPSVQPIVAGGRAGL
jgi:hypothetical protein